MAAARPPPPDHGAGVAGRRRADRHCRQRRPPRRACSRVPARDGFRWVAGGGNRARRPAAARRRRAADRRALGGLSPRGSQPKEAGLSERAQARLVARLRHLSDLSALLPGHAPATASATSPASPRGCRISPRSASTRSGCRRSSSRRWPTWATTSRTTRAVDPMFGIARRFRPAGRRGAPARPEGHHRPGAVAHLRPAPLVQGKPRQPRQRQGRLVRLGRRQAGRHRAEQLAVGLRRPGLGMGRHPQAILHAQFPGLAARPQLPQSGGAGRAAGDRALLAGARRRRLPARHGELLFPRQEAAQQSAAAARQPAGMPDVNPYGYQEHLHDKTQPENLDFLKRFRALLDELWRRAWRSARSATSDRSLETVAAYTSGGDKLQMCYTFDLLGPQFSAAHVRKCVTRLRGGGGRRLDLLGVLQPRRRCATSRAGRARRRPRRGRQVRHRAAGLAARLDLPLPGRGARAGGGRARLRGSARSLRHPLLAGLQGPRRLPHADGLGERASRMAASRTGKPWLPVPEAHRRRAVDRQERRSARCSRTIARCWRSGAGIRRWSPARSNSSRPRATCWRSSAAGDERLLCVFNFAGRRRPNGSSRPSWVSRKSSKGWGVVRASRARSSRSTHYRPASRGSARRGRMLRAPDQFSLYPPARLPFRNLLSFHAQASFVGTTEADEYETLRISDRCRRAGRGPVRLRDGRSTGDLDPCVTGDGWEAGRQSIQGTDRPTAVARLPRSTRPNRVPSPRTRPSDSRVVASISAGRSISAIRASSNSPVASTRTGGSST